MADAKDEFDRLIGLASQPLQSEAERLARSGENNETPAPEHSEEDTSDSPSDESHQSNA